FGGLGLIFITQMELQTGWVWDELNNENSMEMYILEGDDINQDGFPDIIAYTDVERLDNNEGRPEDKPQYGGIYALDSMNGNKLWERDMNNPVKKVFQIMDLDDNGINEYFANIATVGPDWIDHPFNPGEKIPDVYPDMYSNRLINGTNGEDIPILTGDNLNFTNYFIHDLVPLADLTDNLPDLVMIECELKPPSTNEYYYNISSYFANGTKFDTFYLDITWIDSHHIMPAIELFTYNSEEHILFLDKDSISLLNTSSPLFLDPIFNNTDVKDTGDFTVVEDLNGDGFSEILAINWDGNVSIISGIDGTIIRKFIVSGYDNYYIDLLGSNEIDNEAFVLIDARTYHPSTQIQEVHYWILSVTETAEEVIWEQIHESENEPLEVFVLDDDLNGDSLNEIVLFERVRTVLGTMETDRFTVLNPIESKPLAITNSEYGGEDLITIQDIDGDGGKDFTLASYDRVVTFSSADPAGIWKSPKFPLGFPLFITLIVFMGIGLILIGFKGRKLSYRKTNVKEHKLTIVVNTIAIVMMSLTFVLFLAQLNIFNRTLILGDNMTNITIFFLTVIITWYGVLPLTAALYNRFAPNFAFIFIRLRSLFFKISRSYNHDIIVLDMGERKEIGTIIQLKRIILPLLLSIATGFYCYNTLAPIFGYPDNFEVFGSTEFFQFMNGYMLLCVLPMILAFLAFSFFISGNFLLDDAGIVYFRQSKKHRQPGDIEPISIWAQSIIKGIAGLSALITLIGFLSAVDFSGFFGEQFENAGQAIMSYTFGALIIIVFFAGIPFLTSFSYVLLAGEIMEFSMDYNVQKLYSKMKKSGYNITPRDITNIYPSGTQTFKKEELSNTE
ncbi:MAG: hypothetical protein ACFE8J_13760, partial [Candidatus Heimdallarchaeota archaeon]